jgi:phosphatidylserine decarboxylase
MAPKNLHLKKMACPESHQYIDRETTQVKTENLYCDRLINYIYSDVREKHPILFNAVTSSRISNVLGFLNFDLPLKQIFHDPQALAETLGVDLSECLDNPHTLDTPRKFFERKIKYWYLRPMPADQRAIVAPADSKMLVGSLSDQSLLFLKDKFFHFDELIGQSNKHWLAAFRDGNFAVFRLTPDKYHYNHSPVSGRVVDFYQIAGRYHSCNPTAVINMVNPYSKNKRVVTVIDTDVEGGNRIGLVAMIEVVALMIGDIVQCYSDQEYGSPQQIEPGMMLRKGQPKSLYRPGSSVDVLVFQKDRIIFSDDIIINQHRQNVRSRFLQGFSKPLVETDVKVRSQIAQRRSNDGE